MREVELIDQFTMLEQCGVNRRHATGVGALILRQRMQERLGLEIRQDDDRSADMEQRLEGAGHGVFHQASKKTYPAMEKFFETHLRGIKKK